MNTEAHGPRDVSAKLGYAAWIVYGFLTGGDRWLTAGLAGVALMIIVIATEYQWRSIKLMDCTSLAYFAGETLIVLMSGTAFIQRYHLALVWGVFAIVAWITIIAGFPFTLQYTRERMPPEMWDERGFYQMNRHLTVVWAVIFTIGAVLGEIAMHYGHLRLLGMILPLAAMGFGLLFSQLYPRRYAARFGSAGRAVPRASSPRDQSASRIRCDMRSL